MNKNENIIKLKESLNRLENNESIVYFLTYDTKNNPRASVKYIYDLCLTLKNNGVNAKILVEDNTYNGVKNWLGDRYDSLEIVSIKDDKIELRLEDTIVVPEYYSNILEQIKNIKCVKVMLVQQKDYIFENLPIGSRWSDFGFDRVITTTNGTKNYLKEIFPESLIYIIPPIIDDVFTPTNKPIKPYIAISCRDRILHRRIISEFYLKFPQLRWITFRDMVQFTYDDFANNLKECMVSLWVDDESTFGTYPLESMKCEVPVIGKIPKLEPDWLSENGLWTYDEYKIVEILGQYVLSWIEGVELSDEVKNKIKETLTEYDNNITENNIVLIFKSFIDKRIETIKTTIESLNTIE